MSYKVLVVNRLVFVVNTDNQAIVIAFDIKDSEVPNRFSISVNFTNILQVAPFCFLDSCVLVVDLLFDIGVLGSISAKVANRN